MFTNSRLEIDENVLHQTVVLLKDFCTQLA